jgi:endonuclease/exonuclease/phosphatase family metal-dependent hydrolase
MATLGVVGALAVVIAGLFLAAGNKPGDHAKPGPGAKGPTDNVVVATPSGLDIPDLSKYLGKDCVPQQVRTQLVAVSYNIHSANAHRGASLARIGTSLAEMKADVVLLQEVDRHRAKSGYADQPAVLAKALGMTYAYGVNVRVGSQEYGTAILSRFPIISGENTPLPNASGRQPRGLLHAVISVEGIELSVFNTHLDFHGGSLKGTQMKRAAALIATDTRPRLVGGDLNSKPGSVAVAAAHSVADDPFATVARTSANTSPENSPRSRIDYLFQRGNGLRPLGADVPAVALSDHRPVRVAYELSGLTTCR